jgi:PST family polysaccharide transporter
MRRDRNIRALSTKHLDQGFKGRVVRGGLINVASQGLGTLLQLLCSAILARLISPADYGLLAMAGTAIALAAMINNLGLTTPTIQRAEIKSEQVSTLFFLSVISGVVLYFLTCALAPLFASLFSDDRVIPVIVILGLSIPMSAASAQFNAVLMRNMRWSTIQIINLSAQALGALAAILLAWLAGWGVYALVAQGLIAAGLVLILSSILCPWKPTWDFDLRSVRSEIEMGIEILLFNAVNFAHRQTDNIVIGNRWGALELGLYSRGYNLMSQASAIVSGPLTNALIPALSRVADDSDRWRNAFLNSASIVAAGAGALFSVLWAARSPLIAILYGPKWAGVTEIFGFLALAGLVTSVCSPFSWAFVTLGRTRLQVYWILFASPILVVAFWFGASAGGLGVARAYATTVALLNFVYVVIALHKTSVTWWEGWSLKLGVYFAAAAVILGDYLTDHIMTGLNVPAQLVARAGLAGGIYVTVMIAMSILLPVHRGIRSAVRSGLGLVGQRLFRS